MQATSLARDRGVWMPVRWLAACAFSKFLAEQGGACVIHKLLHV
jgi:hypothetical protein